MKVQKSYYIEPKVHEQIVNWALLKDVKQGQLLKEAVEMYGKHYNLEVLNNEQSNNIR